MRKFVRTVIWSSEGLPKSIFAEFVNVIFTSLPPVALIGVTFGAIGVLVAAKENDLFVWGIVALGAAITVGRILLILTYRTNVRLDGI